jgi:hypothetical protein
MEDVQNIEPKASSSSRGIVLVTVAAWFILCPVKMFKTPWPPPDQNPTESMVSIVKGVNAVKREVETR